MVGGAGGGGGADGAGDVDGASGAGDVDGARGAGGGADSGGSVGCEEVDSCDSRVMVNIVHVPIQSKKSKIQVSYLCRPDKRVTPIHPHFSSFSRLSHPPTLCPPAS